MFLTVKEQCYFQCLSTILAKNMWYKNGLDCFHTGNCAESHGEMESETHTFASENMIKKLVDCH